MFIYSYMFIGQHASVFTNHDMEYMIIVQLASVISILFTNYINTSLIGGMLSS